MFDQESVLILVGTRFASVIRGTILSLVIGHAGLAQAVSIYDVIELSRQNFTDEQLVRIIQGTGSSFELTAEDIPRLKNLGVSETVIRAMLTTDPAESADNRSGNSPQHEDTDDHAHAGSRTIANDTRIPKSADSAAHDNSDHHGQDEPTLPASSRQFSVKPVSEEGAGGHSHAYVTVKGLPILVLRDEGRFQSVRNRGEIVAQNLEAAIGMGDGYFNVIHHRGAELIVFQSDKFAAVTIITINNRDVHAYDVRSERRVTPDLLAAYWAALLNDYWDIALRNRAPSRLVKLHRGDALMLLFDLVKRSESKQKTDLQSAALQLPGTIQGHLGRLAYAVPDDFENLQEQVGDAQ